MIICKYSEEFINEVKECYPELTGLHELAETDNDLLGSQLLELIDVTKHKKTRVTKYSRTVRLNLIK